MSLDTVFSFGFGVEAEIVAEHGIDTELCVYEDPGESPCDKEE